MAFDDDGETATNDPSKPWQYAALDALRREARLWHRELRNGLTADIKASRFESSEEVRELKEEVRKLREEFRDQYVTKTEFGPIAKGFYGLIALILSGVVVAWMALVIRSAK